MFAEPTTTQNLTNWVGPEQKEIQAAIAEAGATIDPVVRKAAFEKANIAMNENAITWYSGHTAVAFINQPNIKGLATWTLPSGTRGVGIPAGEGRVWNVWIAAE